MDENVSAYWQDYRGITQRIQVIWEPLANLDHFVERIIRIIAQYMI
ncbi:hypothetical protein V1284_000223 [Nitrobacteraceae bacterium AZCC 2299]